MVYVEELGTLLDAPIDIVWEYMASEQHDLAHRDGLRYLTVKELTPSSRRIDAERRRQGRWERFAGRTTDLAPVGILNEELDSSMTGTAMALVYSPRGGKTQVDVYGEIVSSTIPERELAREAREIVESACTDDLAGLSEFARGKRGAKPTSLRLSHTGGRFAARVDVVWKYLLAEGRHDRGHRSTRSPGCTALPGSSFLVSLERRWEQGRWTKEVQRVTPLKPVALGVEWIEGPLRGSKTIYLYRPRGATTQIDAHGEFTSSTIPLDRLERAVRELWSTEFEEDASAVRTAAAE